MMDAGERADPGTAADLKAAIAGMEAALYHDMGRAERAGEAAFAPDARVRMCAPFGDLAGWFGWWERCLAPLAEAWPDVERRVQIRIAGADEHGALWVGCGGFYLGTFERDWLGIPATRRVAHMRFHEFFRVAEGRVVEVQALWDIPEAMMQARAWPLAPSLGRDWHVPGPATGAGRCNGPQKFGKCQISERSNTASV